MTPTRTRRSLTVAAAVASAAALALGACSEGGAPTSTSTGGGGGGAGDNSGYTIAMVTHETPGDTFWDKIKAGANQAAENNGITLKYSNDPDPGKQATLIQNAVDSKVDGIATTLATPDALAGAVKSAADAGIPRRRLQLRHRPVPGRSARRCTSGPTRTSPARRPASGSPMTAARRCSA